MNKCALFIILTDIDNEFVNLILWNAFYMYYGVSDFSFNIKVLTFCVSMLIIKCKAL